MRLATIRQSQNIDRKSQKIIPAETLMEDAGAQAAQVIHQSYLPELSGGSVGIFCGPGNNGGDGLVIARHLHCMGVKQIRVLLLDESKMNDLSRIQLQRVRSLNIEVFDLKVSRGAANHRFRLAVDALFGLGLDRPLEDFAASCVNSINALKCPVVAVDLPSGLNADTGEALGVCVRADMSISFGLAKPGFFLRQGPEHVGRLKILPISFPPEILREEGTSHFLFTDRNLKALLPRRVPSSNKSHHGKVTLFAGSPGKWGAAVLSARAAFRVGAGYVSIAGTQANAEALEHLPEAMSIDPSQFFERPSGVVVVGPGLGTGEETLELLLKIKKAKLSQVVLDADALTVVAQERLFPLPPSWVLTPHAGELSRLLKLSSQELDRDPCGFALKAHETLGSIVLFKGFHSVVAHQGKCVIIRSGNAALAKAGSGDVLAGFIGGLMAQGLTSFGAVCAGAFVHGKLADMWIRSGRSALSLNPSDLLLEVPRLLGIKT